MTTWLQRAAMILLPGGLLLYCAALCFRCRHRRELACTLPDGARGLQCRDCLRTRPHPWGGAEPRYRRTQEGGRLAAQPTGIERAVEEAAMEAQEIADALYLMERRQRHEEIGLRVVSRFGRCNDTASR